MGIITQNCCDREQTNKRIRKRIAEICKTVERIDAYEYGEKALFERIRAVDYVYVCIDSVPHHVTNFLKSEIELMEKTEFFIALQ